MEKFDITVIGSGPGGYVAAIRLAQLGFSVALIERYSALGGTCLNVGCIPSKALLDSSEHYHNAAKTFKEHGIDVEKVNVNFTQMIARKAKVVEQNNQGITYLMDKNKIKVFLGHASFVTEKKISIVQDDKEIFIETGKTIIATGSKPSSLPFIKIDKKRVITSTEALSLAELPKTMIVIGGGVIGVEMGSVYARLGTKVTIVEYMDSIIPTMDKDMGKELGRVLKKSGIEIKTEHQVTAVTNNGNNVTVKAKDKRGNEQIFEAEYCLVAIGRRPFTRMLGLENIGVTVSDKGFVLIDNHFETNIKGVYAIGDVVGGAMLAHKAEDEGTCVAEIIAGQKPHIDYSLIPGVVYTWPEVAAVGTTEEELKTKNIPYKKGTFQMRALGRSRASMDIDGVIKVLAHEHSDEILGVHMIGARAADMIAEAVVAMEFKASAEDIGRISHAHPTYTEAFKEACLAATSNRSIHS